MSTPSRRLQLMRVYGDKTKRKPTRRDRQFLNPKKKLTKKERQFLNPSTYRVKLAKSRKKRKTKRRKRRKRRKTKRRKRRKRRKTRKRRYKVVGGLSDLGQNKLDAMIASGMLRGSKGADKYRMDNIKFLQGLTSEEQEGEEGLDFDSLPIKK